jgi:hypothetical protein
MHGGPGAALGGDIPVHTHGKARLSPPLRVGCEPSRTGMASSLRDTLGLAGLRPVAQSRSQSGTEAVGDGGEEAPGEAWAEAELLRGQVKRLCPQDSLNPTFLSPTPNSPVPLSHLRLTLPLWSHPSHPSPTLSPPPQGLPCSTESPGLPAQSLSTPSDPKSHTQPLIPSLMQGGR